MSTPRRTENVLAVTTSTTSRIDEKSGIAQCGSIYGRNASGHDLRQHGQWVRVDAKEKTPPFGKDTNIIAAHHRRDLAEAPPTGATHCAAYDRHD